MITWTDIGAGFNFFTPDAGNFNNYIRVVATGSGSYGGTVNSASGRPGQDPTHRSIDQWLASGR